MSDPFASGGPCRMLAYSVDVALRALSRFCSTEDQLEEQAEKPAIFVPIQIDIDVDTFKIRDAFVWNINGARRSSLSCTSISCH